MNTNEVYAMDREYIFLPLEKLAEEYSASEHYRTNRTDVIHQLHLISCYAHSVHTSAVADQIEDLLKNTENAMTTDPTERSFPDEVLLRNNMLVHFNRITAKYWTLFDWYNDPSESYVFDTNPNDRISMQMFKKYARRKIKEYTENGKKISSEILYIEEWKKYLQVMIEEITQNEEYCIVNPLEDIQK